MDEELRDLRRAHAATEYVHALVTAVLPAVVASARRGPQGSDDLVSAFAEFTADKELSDFRDAAAQALRTLKICPDSEDGLALMVLASRTATFVVFCSVHTGLDPVALWQDFVLNYTTQISGLL